MKNRENYTLSSFLHIDMDEEEVKMINALIRTLDAISRITFRSIYIVDLIRHKFLYASDNPLFLCGNTPQEFIKKGYEFYLEYVPLKEQSMLREVLHSGLRFLENRPVDDWMLYSVSCDFHVIDGKKKKLVSHQLVPLMLKGKHIWLAACMVSLSSRDTAGHIKLQKADLSHCWHYSLEKHCWLECKSMILCEREKDILFYSAKGYTMSEIAEKLLLSVDTVKFYKRRLFEKLDVKNTPEALLYAINSKLF